MTRNLAGMESQDLEIEFVQKINHVKFKTMLKNALACGVQFEFGLRGINPKGEPKLACELKDAADEGVVYAIFNALTPEDGNKLYYDLKFQVDQSVSASAT